MRESEPKAGVWSLWPDRVLRLGGVERRLMGSAPDPGHAQGLARPVWPWTDHLVELTSLCLPVPAASGSWARI
jgi:hypothetical protein